MFYEISSGFQHFAIQPFKKRVLGKGGEGDGEHTTFPKTETEMSKVRKPCRLWKKAKPVEGFYISEKWAEKVVWSVSLQASCAPQECSD